MTTIGSKDLASGVESSVVWVYNKDSCRKTATVLSRHPAAISPLEFFALPNCVETTDHLADSARLLDKARASSRHGLRALANSYSYVGCDPGNTSSAQLLSHLKS
jgi:hypothetical protein